MKLTVRKNRMQINLITGLISLLLSLGVNASDAKPLNALSCLINPSKTVNIASPVVGVVDALYVKKGDILKKDQVILTLNSEVEKVNLRSAQAQVDFFERKLGRNKELLKQKLVSELEKDELTIDLQQARLKLDEAQSTLSLKTLKSPLAGVVHQKMIEEGELVGQKPVLQVLQLNPLYVEVIFAQNHYNDIQVQQVLNITTQLGGQAQPFSGTVLVKDAIIDAASETFGVRVQVENTHNQLIAGQKCQLSQ